MEIDQTLKFIRLDTHTLGRSDSTIWRLDLVSDRYITGFGIGMKEGKTVRVEDAVIALDRMTGSLGIGRNLENISWAYKCNKRERRF